MSDLRRRDLIERLPAKDAGPQVGLPRCVDQTEAGLSQGYVYLRTIKAALDVQSGEVGGAKNIDRVCVDVDYHGASCPSEP